MQGLTTTQGYQLGDLAFFWFADMMEETELALTTWIMAGNWLRLRFHHMSEPEDNGLQNNVEPTHRAAPQGFVDLQCHHHDRHPPNVLTPLRMLWPWCVLQVLLCVWFRVWCYSGWH